MANLNKVLLIGRLTRDPELRYTQGGTAVTEFGIAINREYTTADGTRKKDTCFVDIVLWARRAEVACQYLKKGSPIFVEGRLELDQWQSQEGQKRSRLRVVADNFQFLERAGGGGRPGEDMDAAADAATARPPRRDDSSPPPKGKAPAGAPPAGGDDFGLEEDEVPF